MIREGQSDKLWDDFRNGSAGAYEEIYRTYAKVLLYYGRKINSDRQTVYDTVHELFFQLWERKRQLSPTPSIKNYLLKSLRTSLYKASQNKSHFNLEYLLYENDSDLFESRESEIITMEETETKKKLIKRAIIELSKREQEVLHLKFFEDMTTKEISELMGVRLQSIRNTSFSAISKLRAFFKSKELD